MKKEAEWHKSDWTHISEIDEDFYKDIQDDWDSGKIARKVRTFKRPKEVSNEG